MYSSDSVIKEHLLLTAAQAAFLGEDFNEKGGRIWKGVNNLLAKQNPGECKTKDQKMALVQFLEKYQPEHEAVYKSLACVELKQLWKNLKYGSMPATVMAIFVPALKLSVSFFKLKPVSHYVSLRFSSENSEQYGQQQRVISDIKFLKEEIGRKPSTIFSVFAGETFTFWRSFLDDKIKGSPVPKFGSAPQDKLRIIAFLNDLDHYEDSVLVRVLQVLNTVLKVCKINFIVALDKNIIRKAFQTSSENKDDVDHPIAKYEAIPTENNVWACNGQVNTRGDIEKGIQLTSTEKSKEPQEMANSKEEIVTFRRLNCFASEIPNLRHSYTKYHNFARNVISKTMGNHRENSHQWKVELVAWIFICSQWRHEMNILIKDWHTYIDFKEDEKMKQEPSLKDIVANYIKK